MKAVLFDIDDTLFSTTEFARNARARAVDAMIETGLDATHEEIAAELQEVVREFGSNYNQHYNKLIQRLPPHQKRDVNPALIVAAGMAAYHDTKFKGLRAFDDVEPFLKALSNAKIRTGIITHGWTTKQSEKLIRLGLVPLLGPRNVFISDQVGISKPNPKLYSVALQRMGLRPDEALYVGDNLEHDVAPARSLGMRTAWSTRAAKPNQDTSIQPDHVIADFRELAHALREQHGVDLAEF